MLLHFMMEATVETKNLEGLDQVVDRLVARSCETTRHALLLGFVRTNSFWSYDEFRVLTYVTIISFYVLAFFETN